MKGTAKKWTAAMMALGLTMAGAAGYLAYAAGNPYETYKQAAFATAKFENVTTTGSFAIKNNGATVLTGTMQSSQDGENSYSLAKLEWGGQKHEIESSNVGGLQIMRQDDKYTSIDRNGGLERKFDREDREMGPQSQKLANMVLDLIVGDVKNQFAASGNEVTIHLEGAQIPELANVAFGAMIENKEDRASMAEQDDIDLVPFKELVPEIVSDGRIQSFDAKATLANGKIEAQDISFVITGKDASGQSLNVEFTGQFDITDVGTTTVKAIDTTGKTVEALDPNLSIRVHH